MLKVEGSNPGHPEKFIFWNAEIRTKLDFRWDGSSLEWTDGEPSQQRIFLKWTDGRPSQQRTSEMDRWKALTAKDHGVSLT